MSPDGRENVLGSSLGLPLRALAGSAGAKVLEALTLAGLVLLVPRALGAADYGRFAVALAVATGIATATGIGGPALFARVLGPLARRGAPRARAGAASPARRGARRRRRRAGARGRRRRGVRAREGERGAGRARARRRRVRHRGHAAVAARARARADGGVEPALSARERRHRRRGGRAVPGRRARRRDRGDRAGHARGAGALGLAGVGRRCAAAAAGARCCPRGCCGSRGCRPRAAR